MNSRPAPFAATVRAQHDQIVQTRTHHAAIRRKHRIAVIFVKLAENPREIACRIVDLHVLPVRHRGDGRAGKQHVAIREPAMHRQVNERPQALRLDDPAQLDVISGGTWPACRSRLIQAVSWARICPVENTGYDSACRKFGRSR